MIVIVSQHNIPWIIWNNKLFNFFGVDLQELISEKHGFNFEVSTCESASLVKHNQVNVIHVRKHFRVFNLEDSFWELFGHFDLNLEFFNNIEHIKQEINWDWDHLWIENEILKHSNAWTQLIVVLGYKLKVLAPGN